MQDMITATEFEGRLGALCLSGPGATFPRRLRDRHILYRSIVQTLDPTRSYSEGQLNEALQQWLAGIGTNFEMDHVTLRRYLVDERYVLRDAGGTAYVANHAWKGHVEFEEAVGRVDSSMVIQAAKDKVAERKREQTGRARS